MVSLLFSLLLTTALWQDTILLPNHGAVAERCGQVAINKGPAFLSMILRLEIPDEEIHFDDCFPDEHGKKFLELDKELRVPTWMIANCSTNEFTASAQKPLVIQLRKPGIIQPRVAALPIPITKNPYEVRAFADYTPKENQNIDQSNIQTAVKEQLHARKKRSILPTEIVELLTSKVTTSHKFITEFSNSTNATALVSKSVVKVEQQLKVT